MSQTGQDPESGALRNLTYTAQERRALPTPSELGEYDVKVPGSADRILAFAEREQAHRHSQDKAATESQRIANAQHVKLAIFNGSFRFSLGLTAVIAITYVSTSMEFWQGLVMIGGAAIVQVLISALRPWLKKRLGK